MFFVALPFDAVLAASHQVGADTVIALDAQHSVTLQHAALNSLHASAPYYGATGVYQIAMMNECR
jgi:hypothetical protein